MWKCENLCLMAGLLSLDYWYFCSTNNLPLAYKGCNIRYYLAYF